MHKYSGGPGEESEYEGIKDHAENLVKYIKSHR